MTLRLITISFIAILLACQAFASELIYNPKRYQAIVIGKIVKEKIEKHGSIYITEYKLKTKKWLFKKPYIEESKYITLRILGADIPEKGIIIKASTSPDYIPINKEAVFLLEKNKLRQSNVFTVSKDGIVSKEQWRLSINEKQ